VHQKAPPVNHGGKKKENMDRKSFVLTPLEGRDGWGGVGKNLSRGSQSAPREGGCKSSTSDKGTNTAQRGGRGRKDPSPPVVGSARERKGGGAKKVFWGEFK